MKKIFYILAFISISSFGKIAAQQGFSVGLGGGPTFYLGSFNPQNNIGINGLIDARYHFNSKLFIGFAYSYNTLQADRVAGDKTAYYFNTTANNVDFHFGFNILQLTRIASEDFPLRVTFDMGAGFSFFDEALYYGDASPREDSLHYGYQKEHGPGSSLKAHMGAEVSYNINESFSVFASALLQHYFTSALDGKTYWAATTEYPESYTKPLYDDNFYSLTLGIHYHFPQVLPGHHNSSFYYKNDNKGKIFKSLKAKISPRKKSKTRRSKPTSYNNNNSNPYPGGRFQGKKKNGGIPD